MKQNTKYKIQNTKKLGKKIIFFLSVILTAGAGILLYGYISSKPASAAWFDTNWAFRKSIAITAHTASENSVYINLTGASDLDTSDTTKFQSDCGDLRFTKQNGEILPYYIVSGCGTADTVIHVNFDTFPAGAQTIYYYYDNPSAPNGGQGSDFATEASNYTIGSQGSEEQSPDPVAYWKFDDGTGQSSQDSTPNNNDGTLGATSGSSSDDPAWVTEDRCISGKCLNFDGSNDYVSIADNNSLDFGTGAFSVSSWFRFTGSSVGANGAYIFDHASSGINDRFSVRILEGGSNTIRTFIKDSNNNSIYRDSVTTVTDNRWHHIYFTWSGSTINIYIDGKLNQGPQTGTRTGTVSPNSTAAIGCTGIAPCTGFFQGFIDEEKIYPYTRSATQVKTDFLAGKNAASKQGSSIVLGSSPQEYLSQGLIGYWKMDEASGNATDSSGNGTTLTNNGTTTFSGGKFGNTSTYNGSSQYLNTATAINGVKTVSFWAYTPDTTNYFLNLINSSAYITSSSGTFTAAGFTSPSIYINGVLNGTLSANTWSHVVVTTNTGVNANAFAVGLTNDGSNHFYTNGSKMDEVRLYNRALSPKEVSDLYNWAPGPVGYWNFEEGSGASANDTSGNSYNGIITGAAFTPGKYGKALNFNGSTDAVDTISSISGIQTVSFWVNPSSTTSNLIDLQTTPGTINISASSGTISATGFTSPTIYVNGVVSSTLAANQWQYITVTTGTAITGSAIRFGRISTTSLTGKLDDIKFYSYTQTQKQIVSDMNAGHPAIGSPVGSAVGHWKFDEGYSTVTNNSGNSGSTLNGTLTNMATAPSTSTSGWTNSGKFGKALIFDGSNDVATIANSNPIDMDTNLAQFTYSTWINAASAGENNVGQIYQKGTNTYLRVDTPSGSNLDIEAKLDLATTDANVNISAPITTNTWHHLVETWDGTTLTIYIDGIKRGTGTGSGAISSDTNNLLIGGTTTANFAGTIDEFKIYNYALTVNEVKLDMNRGASEALGSLGTNTTAGPVQAASQEYCQPGDNSTTCTAPAGKWDFEEGTGTSVNDTSGNGNTGTWNGTGAKHWDTGKIGKTGNFNGSDDYVNIPDTASTSPTGNMTISAWVNPAALSNIIIAKMGTATQNAYYLNIVSSGKLRFWLSGTGSSSVDNYIDTDNVVLTAGVWKHVEVVYNSSAQTVTFYVNGAIVPATLQGGSIPSSIYNSNQATTIGAYRNSSSVVAAFYQGKIDQVKLFNYARSAAQVAYDYNRGKPVGWWKMDECQGQSVYDSSGNSNTGTIAVATGNALGTCQTASTFWGGSSSGAGKRNYAPTFDGTDDKVTISTIITGVQSVSFWVKPTISTDSLMDLDGGTHYITASSGTVSATGFSTPTIYVNGISGGTITGGAWNHIVVTTATYFNTTSNFTLGYKSAATADYLNGQLDDVKVFNYALTAAQVKTEYSGGAINFGPVTGSP